MFTEDSGLFARFKNLFNGNNDDKDTVAMQTRKVVGFDETTIPRPTSFADIINEPISTSPPVAVRTVSPSAPSYTVEPETDLDIRFAEKFIGQGGKFLYCETVADVIEELRHLKSDNNWHHIFTWENEIKDAFNNYNFQKGSIGFTIENSSAVVSLCECIVAEDGSIIFNPKQASRRTLPCFPDTHIIIADATRLNSTLAKALQRFNQLHKPELPSILNLGDAESGHFYDQSRLLLRAEGTKNVIVILVDEIIPPSVRP